MSRFVTEQIGPEPKPAVESFDIDDLSYEMAMESIMDPVVEGYVGKTSNLLKMESVVDAMIKKYGSNNARDMASHVLDDCPEKRELENLLEKEFGFSSAELMIRPVAAVNMITYPKSMLLRDFQCEMPTALTAHGERYYDESHNYCFYCVLYTELFNGVMTAEEIVAFLLHEVGHQFDVCTMSYIGDVLFWMSMFSPIGLLVGYFRQEVGFFVQRIMNAIDSITPYRLLANFGIKAGRFISMALGPLGSTVGALGSIINKIEKAPSEVVKDILTFGFAGEKFADSFVSAYGYGSAWISALDKSDRIMMTTNRGFLIDTWTWAGSAAPVFLYMFMDPHPENQTRCKMILQDMKALANSDLPPNMRKAVKADYERCAKAYEAYLDVDPDHRNAIALRFSRNFKERLGGKIDFRTYLYRLSAVQAGVWRARSRH